MNRPRPLTPAEARVVRIARKWARWPWDWRIDLINAVEKLEDELKKKGKKR